MVSTPDLAEWLQHAVARVNAGDLRQGRDLLEKVLEHDPANDRAWLWLSGCVEDPRQRLICLQQALRANPDNQAARDGLKVLDGELVQISAPSLLESRLAAIGIGGREMDRLSAEADPSPESPAVMPVLEESPAPPVDVWAYPTGSIEQDAPPAAGRPRKRVRWWLLVVAALLALGIVTYLLIGPAVLLPLLSRLGTP